MTVVAPVARARRLTRLGLWCARRRWTVLAAALLTLVALWGLAGTVGGQLGQSLSLPGTESAAAVDRLTDAGFDAQGRQAGTAVVHDLAGVDRPAVREPVRAFLEAIDRDVDDVAVTDPFADPEGRLIAAGGDVAVARLDFAHDDLDAALAAAARISERRDGLELPAGASVELGGDLFAEEPDFSSTGLGLVAAAVILFVAFGSLLAMGLPLVTALLAIGCGVAVVQLASRWIDIPPFAPAAVAMIGLGAGINYALFVVTRYREELAAGHDPPEAIARAMSTAGRAAVFAGVTVISSLLGLLVVGIDDVRSLALSIVAGVAFVIVASVTVLPALLRIVGGRIDRFGLRHRRRLADADVQRSPWYRWSRLLQRRPAPVALATAAVLLVLAAPVVDLRLGIADATTRSPDDTTRRAHELVADGFGEGFNGPVLLAVSLPEPADGPAVLDGLAADLGDRPDVAAALPPVLDEEATTALVQVIPETGPQDARTAALVRELRETAVPAALAGTGADALIGGVVAAGIDFADINAQVLPWFVGVVLVVAFALLVAVFRSLLVPAKAVAVNLLTVGAAYGTVVAVFQWGWLGPVFGHGPGPIEPWVPMMLFAITFGLSIDYEVFLLSRIRERYEATGDSSEAVAHGLARSARLIFAAAAIMVCVFGAFALLADRELQMLGLGLAVAIAVDATLVRLVLVPTTLELLGDRNWWLPRWWPRARLAAAVDAALPDQPERV